jgi:hypothetical protein
MRARVPITIGGLGVAASVALSAILGSGGLTVLGICLSVLGGLAFGAWVLSANDRTERLERLIRALRGPGGTPTDRSGRKN